MDLSYFGSIKPNECHVTSMSYPTSYITINDGLQVNGHYGIDFGWCDGSYYSTNAYDYEYIDEKITELKKQLRITENYLELIREVAFDNRHRFAEEMKTIQRLASLGMMCDTTETIRYDEDGNGYNILNEKTKDGENNG